MIKELMIAYPIYSVIIAGFLITLAMTLVTKYFTDQKRMKELRTGQKELQKNLRERKGDIKAQEKINKDMMNMTFEMMKHSFKPLIITAIPIILLIWWLKGVYIDTTLGSSWIWWYIGSAIISSIVLRKVLDVA
ncbi:DUF106 domain-containing protein [Candidatus Pacearchaeota archaeon]|nr:DUF106 domain-containing protein [Candidatus Pacearchaeota archaeon]